jgi:heme exporter protein CcmD
MLDLGKYTTFIISAYGATLFISAILVLQTLRDSKKYKKLLSSIEENDN